MKPRESGHTIVELLVVVAVLVILAGIVLPSSSLGEDRKLDTLQLSIQDAIDHAQSLSYHEGVPYGVRFSVKGQWFGVANEVGVPVDDPLTHGDYVMRLKSPDMPSNCTLDYALFGVRPLIAFDSKGILVQPGEVHLRCGSTERWLSCDAATNKLTPIAISPY